MHVPASLLIYVDIARRKAQGIKVLKYRSTGIQGHLMLSGRSTSKYAYNSASHSMQYIRRASHGYAPSYAE
jgi:hypothetical protein